MNYKEAKAYAEEIDKTLMADTDFNNTVHIIHGDGTKLELHYATLKRDGEWIMVFTEHNGIFVYHNEDLNKCEEFIGDKNFDALKESLGEILDGVTEENLNRIDKDAKNFKDGIVSEPIDLDKYIEGEEMKTVAIEDLMIGCISTFTENAAELGCPRNEEVDMWFRYLSYEEQRAVVEKMMEIEERNLEMIKEEKEMKKDKIIEMVEMEIDLDEKIIDNLVKLALKEIKKDKPALINYIVNKILVEIVETDGECLKDIVE